MGIVLGCVFILPAVIVVGWIVSWWGTRRVRWVLLAAAVVVSVLCVVIGWIAMGPPVDPHTLGCSPAIECMDLRPLIPVAAGLLGVACCLVLLVPTTVVEAVRAWRGRRASA